MIKTLTVVMGLSAGFVLWSAGCNMSNQSKTNRQVISGVSVEAGKTAMEKHPASQALSRLFAQPNAKPPRGFSSGITSKDYLTLVAGNVDFYKQHQNDKGAIIDPVQKKEVQYSTPSFALATATLVAHANRKDLLEPSIRAMTFATHALANHTTADFHADFYIPMLIHTRRILMTRVPKEMLEQWDADLRSIVPETTYRDTDAHANWNLVQIDGETMRHKDGLLATTQATSQPAYIEKSLNVQEKRFTKFGMYTDPNMPLAYDAFPRLWLEDMMADGAYDGPHAQQIRDFLMLGGLSSLLILSPTGEWATGGRSAQHQWNEAENIVIFEINARKWHAIGRDDIAGAMKRSAHLAYESMKRWQRPTGEMWIVKNRAEPDTRLGYEGYSSHSQYNLLPMAMLCIAHARADDSIAERPAPCEVGGFVFDVREKFHKVFANAGGMYVEIDTAADPHYNGTGLQRVHRKGVPLSPLSDTTGSHRAYGPTTDKTMIAMSPGIQWSASKPTTKPSWHSLAEFVQPVEPKPAKGEKVVESAHLEVTSESPAEVGFVVTYMLGDEGKSAVRETYTVRPDGVEGTTFLDNNSSAAKRVLFPALVNDGARDLPVMLKRNVLEANREGSVLRWEVTSPANVTLKQEGPRVVCHNGYMQAVVGELPESAPTFSWKLTLENEK